MKAIFFFLFVIVFLFLKSVLSSFSRILSHSLRLGEDKTSRSLLIEASIAVQLFAFFSAVSLSSIAFIVGLRLSKTI